MTPINKSPFQVYRDERYIPCAFREAFVVRNESVELETLLLRQDGVIEMSGECYDFSQIQSLVLSGQVQTKLKNGKCVIIRELICRFTASKTTSFVKEDDLLRDIRDVLDDLNGVPTSIDRCVLAYEAYTADSNEENRSRLRVAFHDIPTHRDISLSGFRRIDADIRRIIDEEV